MSFAKFIHGHWLFAVSNKYPWPSSSAEQSYGQPSIFQSRKKLILFVPGERILRGSKYYVRYLQYLRLFSPDAE